MADDGGRKGDGAPGEADLARLVEAARAVLPRAHNPYSGLAVGAALLAEDGRVFVGCNVENASYGLTLCAERGAVARAVAEGATRFRALAVAASARAPVTPCGACRQVLREFAESLPIVIVGEDGGERRLELAELLPDAMGPSDL